MISDSQSSLAHVRLSGMVGDPNHDLLAAVFTFYAYIFDCAFNIIIVSVLIIQTPSHLWHVLSLCAYVRHDWGSESWPTGGYIFLHLYVKWPRASILFYPVYGVFLLLIYFYALFMPLFSCISLSILLTMLSFYLYLCIYCKALWGFVKRLINTALLLLLLIVPVVFCPLC